MMFRSFSVLLGMCFGLCANSAQGCTALDEGRRARALPLFSLGLPFAILPASKGVRSTPSTRSDGGTIPLAASTPGGACMEGGGSNRSVLSMTAPLFAREKSPRERPESKGDVPVTYRPAYGCGAVEAREEGASEWGGIMGVVAVPTIRALSAPLASAGQDVGASTSAARGQLLLPLKNQHHSLGAFFLSTVVGVTVSAGAATSPTASTLTNNRLVLPLTGAGDRVSRQPPKFDYAAENLRVLDILFAHACSKGKALREPRAPAVFTVGKKKRA